MILSQHVLLRIESNKGPSFPDQPGVGGQEHRATKTAHVEKDMGQLLLEFGWFGFLGFFVVF